MQCSDAGLWYGLNMYWLIGDAGCRFLLRPRPRAW